jgi:hypothetical protein
LEPGDLDKGRGKVVAGSAVAFCAIGAAIVWLWDPFLWRKAPSPEPANASQQFHITGASGGRVSLPDGATVEFPPGAVEGETDIRLSRHDLPNVPFRDKATVR